MKLLIALLGTRTERDAEPGRHIPGRKGLTMRHKWVVFFYEDRELLRYTLYGEAEGEREETMQMLAYENGIPADEIGWTII